MADYKTIRGTSTFEYEEKRSRFIASVGHTPGVEEAKAFIEQIKAEFEDARHNCWAYCAGAAGSTDRCVFRERHLAQSSNPAALRYSNQRR